MEGGGVEDGRFDSHPAFRATRKPRHPQQNTPYRSQRKSAKTRSDNSGSIGIIGAAVLTRGAGSHFKPPPNRGADGRQLSEPVSPSITKRLVPRRVVGPFDQFCFLHRNLGQETPRHAPNDERNRAQERSLFPQWRPCGKVILGCVTPLSLCF